MQPFARPVIRAVWGHARLSLDRTARPLKAFRRPTRTLDLQSSTAFNPFVIRSRARFYSSQPPSKDTNSNGLDEKKPELKPAENPSTTESKSSSASDQFSDSKSKIEALLKSKFKDNISLPELPSTLDSYRSGINKRFSHLMDTLQARTMNASQTLNDITGYTSIEHIKKQNAGLETALADAHERLRIARHAYKQANSKRAATQREVTTLLARKDTWSPADLERFTELYRTDHILEGEVSGSQEALTEAEVEEQSLSQRLNAGILKRYHEEQIWSDRIRRASTWGTWGLMGMNFLLFVVLQFFAEPWRRKRLVKGVVAEEKAVLEEVRKELEEIKLVFEKKEALAEMEAQARATAPVEELPEEISVESSIEVPTEVPAEILADVPQGAFARYNGQWKEILLDPLQWREVAEDLYSDRPVHLRMRDASLLALEGAIAGALLAILLFRRS